MTVDEKYNRRIELCKTLRDIEDELVKIVNVRNKYSDSERSKKATLSIYVEGENIQYELSEITAIRCIGAIEDNYSSQLANITIALKQELK